MLSYAVKEGNKELIWSDVFRADSAGVSDHNKHVDVHTFQTCIGITL